MRKLKDINYLALSLNNDVFNQMKALPSDYVSKIIGNEFSEMAEFSLNYGGFNVNMECNLYQAVKLDTIFNTGFASFSKVKKNNFCDEEKPFLHNIDALLLDYYKADLLDSPIIVRGVDMDSSFTSTKEAVDNFLEHWLMTPNEETELSNIIQSLISTNSIFGKTLMSVEKQEANDEKREKIMNKRDGLCEAIISLYEISDLGCFGLNGAMIVFADMLEENAIKGVNNDILIPKRFSDKFNKIREDFLEYVDETYEHHMQYYENLFKFSSATGKMIIKNRIIDIFNNNTPCDDGNNNSSVSDFKL